MQFRIILRQTEDWANVNFEQWVKRYRKQFERRCHSDAMGYYDITVRKRQKINQFLSNVIEWNVKYTPNYFQYRKCLNDIARKTWEATGIEIASMETWANFHDEDMILIPTDDDDWFRPDIAQHLEKAFEDECVSRVTWKTWLWRQNHAFQRVKGFRSMRSNSYALRANRANYDHLFSVWLPAMFWNANTSLVLEEALSVYVRNCGSWTSLSRAPLDQIIKKREHLDLCPKDLDWCKESIKGVMKASDLKRNVKQF